MTRWILMLTPVLAAAWLGAMVAGCDGGSGGGNEEEQPDVVSSTPDETGQADLEEVCEPSCDGKECGDDGCGGVCGHCYTIEGSQNDDLCLADQTCTVCGCGEKTCGVDACGSPCGTCGPHFTCGAVGQCVVDSATCTYDGLTVGTSKAKLKSEEGGFYLYFERFTTNEGAMQKLILEADSRLGMAGPTGPGEYNAYFKSFNEGGLWLYGVHSVGEGPEILLAPISGSVIIESLADSGGTFSARLTGVVLQEVEVEDGKVTKVPGGMIWCLDGEELVADLAVTPLECGSKKVGYKIGEAVGNFQLQNCNGEWVDLYESCQKTEALWLVATAGW